MAKKILLLGSTGKMGLAIKEVFAGNYNVAGKNSRDFDALDFNSVKEAIKQEKPDIVINSVALLGIDPCEKEPDKAFRLNALYPKFLAELSNEYRFILVHFSTDAVFNDKKGGFYSEADAPCPLNIYGFTKLGGDCFIQNIAKKYYIFRVSLLFGACNKNNQFVEKILEKVKQGQKAIRISDDIISSPTYSKDVAIQLKYALDNSLEFGLYHIANEGKATLCELIKEIVSVLGLGVKVEAASYREFPHIGIKNTCTPILSKKIKSMRHWKEAVKEYCQCIKSMKGES